MIIINPYSLGALEPETIVYINRTPDPVPATTILWADTLLKQLKINNNLVLGVSNIATKYIKIMIRGAAFGSRANSMINLAQNAFDSTEVNVSNTMGYGKAGFININNSYINENWIPATQGQGVFTLNSGCIGCYSYGNDESEGYFYGAYGDTGVNGVLHQPKRVTSNNTTIFFNNTGTGSSPNPGDIDGLNFLLRTGANTVLRTRNNSLVETLNSAAVALSDRPLYSHAGNGGGSVVQPSPWQMSLLFVGAGNVNWSADSVAFEAFMTSAGISYTQVKELHVYGDSNTAGTGITNNLYRWPSLVARTLGMIEINRAQSGTTLQRSVPIDYFNPTNMYDRQAEIVYSSKIGKIGFAYAVNDARALEAGQANYTAATYASQAGDIIDSTVAKGFSASDLFFVCCTVVNPSVFPNIGVSGYRAFATAMNAVCQSKGAIHIDPFDYMVANGNLTLLGDSIHMNNSGHQVLHDFSVPLLG